MGAFNLLFQTIRNYWACLYVSVINIIGSFEFPWEMANKCWFSLLRSAKLADPGSIQKHNEEYEPRSHSMYDEEGDNVTLTMLAECWRVLI
jgi:hypothetical protein